MQIDRAAIQEWAAQHAVCTSEGFIEVEIDLLAEYLQSIANRAAEREREACAQAAEGFAQSRDWVPGSLYANIRNEVAALIRTRSKRLT